MKKGLCNISGRSLRDVLAEANRLEVKKEQVVTIFRDEEQFYLIYEHNG